MARIRSIHPGLWTDEAFASISLGARILLLGVWTEADDQGVFEWKPVRLKVRIFPADSMAVGPLLDEMEAANLICRFEADDRQYGAVRNFCKWQRPKSPQILHPCPVLILKYVAHVARAEETVERGTAMGRLLHDQQGGVCFYCTREITFYRKKTNSLEVDHRTPISRGGLDVVTNLAASCRECNSLKASMTEEEFRAKFAPEELARIHLSQSAKGFSHNAKDSEAPRKSLSLNANSPNGEMPPQMEDGEEEERITPPIPPLPERKRRRTRTLADYPELGEFWAPYPRKAEGPAACLPAWIAARERASLAEILDGLTRYPFHPDPTKQPQATTWLNQSRWMTQANTSVPNGELTLRQMPITAANPLGHKLSTNRSDW